MPVKSADYLTRLYIAIARAWGVPEHQARIFARAILTGDLMGQHGQGAAIVQICHLFHAHGQLNAAAEPLVEQEKPNFAVLDGQKALGQYVMTRAMEMAIEKAKQCTIGTVWVHNWHDAGCIAAYTRLALEHDCVGLTTINSVPLTAPLGGMDMLMSAAPFCFACPAGEERPILGDMALCGTWDFHMVTAMKEGRKLDQKLLIDPRTGELTDDPTAVVEDETSRTTPIRGATVFPDHKLFLLNIFAEIMTGLLTPGGMTSNQLQYPTSDYVEAGVEVNRGGGGWCMAVNIADLMPVEGFKAKVDTWIRAIKASRLLAGVEEIRMPGEKALGLEERRLIDGVPLREEHWEHLVRMAGELGVDVEAP